MDTAHYPSIHPKILEPPIRPSFITLQLPPRGSKNVGRREEREFSATGRVSIFHAISELASVTRFAELSFYGIEEANGGDEALPSPLCGVATLISDVKWHRTEDKYSGSRHRCPSQRVVRT